MRDWGTGYDLCEQHHTAFADENLVQWLIRSESDLRSRCMQIRALFNVLQDAGMSI